MSLRFLTKIKLNKIIHEKSAIFVSKKRFMSKTDNNSDYVLKSPFPSIELSNASLAEFVIDKFRNYENDIALVDSETGRSIQYSKLTDLIVKTAGLLLKFGVRQGDIVTIFAPNCIEFPLVTLATLLNGSIFSSVNYLYTAEELKKALNVTFSSCIFTIPELCHIVEDALPLCPSVKKIILMNGSHNVYPVLSKILAETNNFSYNVPNIAASSVAKIPFSSGTTGLPKGVLLTHKNITSNLLQIQQKDSVAFSREDSILSVLPFFHMYGLVIVMLAGLVGGARQIVMPKFNSALFMKCMETYKCTYLPVVPLTLQFMVKHPLTAAFKFNSVRNILCGAAPLPTVIVQELLHKLDKNVIIRQAYGQTESGPLISITQPRFFDKYHTIGSTVANTMCKIVDVQTGKSLPVGKTGELYVKGPQVMKGYLNNETATRQALTEDGWFKTGDMCKIDEDGNIIIIDRLKELIKVKGFQVAPAELEALLLKHPSVVDVAVVGVPHNKYGEVPKAYVVKKPNVHLTSKELTDYVEKQVAPFKKIHEFSFILEIPKSASGKILRRLLKDEVAN